MDKCFNVKKQRCVLITGVSGFIGKEFFFKVKHLSPIGIVFSSKMALRDPDIVRVDLRDKTKVADLFNTYMPDVVYHFAALTSPSINEENVELARQSHLDITQNILENMSHNAHLVYLSTDKVFDGSHPDPDEEVTKSPVCEYGKLKLLCENMIKKKIQKYHILRLPIVHSLGDINSTSFIDKALIQIKMGKIVNVYDNVFRCYILLSDLIDLLDKLAHDTNYGVYHAGTEMMSYYDRVESLCVKNGIEYNDLLKPICGSAEPMRQNLDTIKVRDLFKCEFR